jgi:hypothetical protein
MRNGKRSRLVRVPAVTLPCAVALVPHPACAAPSDDPDVPVTKSPERADRRLDRLNSLTGPAARARCRGGTVPAVGTVLLLGSRSQAAPDDAVRARRTTRSVEDVTAAQTVAEKEEKEVRERTDASVPVLGVVRPGA